MIVKKIKELFKTKREDGQSIGGGIEDVATSGELRLSIDKFKSSLQMNEEIQDFSENMQKVLDRLDGNKYKNESKRIGRLCISKELLESNPEVVHKTLSKVVVVKYELGSCESFTEYIAISPHFEILEEEQLIPSYVAVCSNLGNITFDRAG